MKRRELVVTTKFVDAETVEVAVADRGLGLPKVMADELFSRSSQPSARTRPGSRFCRSHLSRRTEADFGSQVNPGGGAILRFSLMSGLAVGENPALVDRTVHVVDDDPAVRRSLERLFLDAAGFHVVSYQSPAAFLNAASGLSAGCVLLDIRMPGVDGLEVQARLNRLQCVNLPVIVMTGHGDVPSAVRAMEGWCCQFLRTAL